MPNKAKLVPTKYQKSGVVLAQWTQERLRQRLERKFNQLDLVG
jgi:hypothetical protein